MAGGHFAGNRRDWGNRDSGVGRCGIGLFLVPLSIERVGLSALGLFIRLTWAGRGITCGTGNGGGLSALPIIGDEFPGPLAHKR